MTTVSRRASVSPRRLEILSRAPSRSSLGRDVSTLPGRNPSVADIDFATLPINWGTWSKENGHFTPTRSPSKTSNRRTVHFRNRLSTGTKILVNLWVSPKGSGESNFEKFFILRRSYLDKGGRGVWVLCLFLCGWACVSVYVSV